MYLALTNKRAIDSTTGCWLFTGGQDKDGYGKIKFNGKTYSAHRLAWRNWVGEPINQILHKPICPNKHCFNPEHLYDGTHSDNMRDRREAGDYINHSQFNRFCARGHRVSEENTYVNKGTGHRQCRICRKMVEGRA